MGKYEKFKTKSIHAKNIDLKITNPLNYPIFQTSTFYFNNFQDLEDTFTLKKRGFVYTRGGNPTVNLLEKRVAELEGGVDAVCFGSGMGAISSVLFSFLKSGDEIIASSILYGSAHSFIEHFLTRYNIDVKFVNLNDIELLKKSISNKTKVIYFETPTNPTLEVYDIELISKIAHEHGIKVVVDNTFLTPYFQNPLEKGADVVVHSMTKYLNGHGDALGGIAIAKDQGYIDFLKFGIMSEIGSVLDPNSAFLILRGLKTLAIRMEEHQKNAIKLANFLKSHKKVMKVYYPGFDDFPFKDIVKKQMKGYGAIVSFEIEGNFELTRKFIESLQIPALAVSLGDCETLVEHPLSMTHRTYLENPESDEYKKLENLVRISVGLEDIDEIIEDLDKALNNLKS